jgi:trans-aconitate 2-methyltransferase
LPLWDADLYLKFAHERTQPALDLIHRISLESPRHIVDLGCGPGNSTNALRRRWPHARITGVDSSPAMIDTARKAHPEGDWIMADAKSWTAAEPVDLVFSNAMLHWLPDHAKVCSHFLAQLKPEGALAIQVPAHYESPLHAEIIAVSKDPAWNDRLEGARTTLTSKPARYYYDALQSLTSRLDLWETIYYHIVSGPEAVLEWFRATGLRPFLEDLSSDQERSRFEHLLLDRYKVAYPRRASGQTLFPFRRLFFVAYR